MKILLITWNYPPKVGGIENLLSQLVQEVSSESFVEIIAPYSEQPDEEYDKHISRASRPGLLWFFIHALIIGIRKLRAKEIDVLWGGSALLSPIVFFLGKVTRTPVVVHTYGLDLIYQNQIYQFFIRRLLPKVERVIAISEETKNAAMKLGVDERKISLIHPGIHVSDYQIDQNPQELKEEFGLNGRKVLLYVGRLAQRKGLHEFVRYAFPRIVKVHPDVVLAVVGGNPEKSLMHKENLRQMIEDDLREKSLTSHVRFFGWLERQDLLKIYSACDVFILPAIHVPGDMEGFGIVLAEANAAGKPVVSSRIGGIPDAVVDGKSAILVEPGDWDAYVDVVNHLLSDPALRNELGSLGTQYGRDELDWQVIGSQFLESLSSLA